MSRMGERAFLPAVAVLAFLVAAFLYLPAGYALRYATVALLTRPAAWHLGLLLALPPQPVDARVIGHIVPGLVAGEALGQGFVRTVAATLLAAAVVRLLLLLVLPWMP